MPRKKKNKFEDISTDSITDNLLESLCEEARDIMGADNVYSGGEEESRIICLPVPAFSLRFLLMQEGFPLSRQTMVVGQPESCKSSLCNEILRWHRLSKGGGVVFETEAKDSPELRRSIVGYDYKPIVIYCQTQDDWNQGLNTTILKLQRKMDGIKSEPGPGRLSPMCFIIDSLTGTMGADIFKEMTSKGIPSMHHATDQRKLADYERYMPKQISNWPFSIVGVHHLKPSTDQRGFPVNRIGGGYAPRFHATTVIEMVRKKDIDRVDEKGRLLGIKTTKNSLAPHNEIEVEMLWYTDFDDIDPITEMPRPKIFFDWHGASIEILSELTNGKGKLAKSLNKIIDLETNDDRRTVSSSTLGISEPCSYREAGGILEEHPDILRAIYPLVGIRTRHLFKIGIDFRTQQEDIKKLSGNLVLKNSKESLEEILASDDSDQNQASDDPFKVSDDE